MPATPLPIASGGTAAASASAARTALGVAAAGANGDITSLTALATPLSVAQGGTGAATLTGVLKGAGTGALAPATAETDYTTPTGTGKITNKRVKKRAVALTDAATILLNTDNGDKFTVTLGGNRTLGDTSGTPDEGDVWTVAVKQDGTGGRTLAVTGTTTIIGKSLGGGTAVPLDTGIGITTLLTFTQDASVGKQVLVGCVVLV